MHFFGKAPYGKVGPPNGVLGPGADEAFAPLTDPSIRRRVQTAYWVDQGRDTVQQRLGRPLGRVLLRRWLQQKSDSKCIEALGLPRHIVEEQLGDEALTLHVDPRKLIRIVAHPPRQVQRRPSSLAFIWEGDWDLRREDLRVGTRYRMIRELDLHRDDLTQTSRYQALLQYIDEGKPWTSHQLGIVLDTPQKIDAFLRVYLDFMNEMAVNGFDPKRGKDPLGVAISREGRILKINRGLHRLAMAQHLGIASIPVRVRHVHRLWWENATEGHTGQAALDSVQRALQDCVPEELPGPMDVEPEAVLPDDYFPPAKIR